jgi:hypothetical protein
MSMITSSSALWKRGIIGAAAILGIVLISATARSNAVNTNVFVDRTLPKDFDAPIQVRGVIQKACLDCHSEQTIWPWYSKVPPISWQIQDDVEKGREFMNFSHWNEYSAEDRRAFAAEIAHATGTHLMPPPKYLWLHPDARLSNADLEVLAEWARHQAK